MPLEGKTGVVTGAGSGMGREIALWLARDGAAIAVWDLNEASARETVNMITKAGGKAAAVKVDVSSAAEVAKATEATHAALGPVAILVNNAGISQFISFMDLTEELWDKMIRINLKGPFLVTKAIIPDMIAANWGRIVNITSSSTQVGGPRMAHYVAAKAGLGGFTKSLAKEFARNGITTNSVPPNFVDTPMLREHMTEEQIKAAIQTSTMGRTADVEDIAAAVSYLCSVEAKHVNGHTLSANGGNYMN